MTSKPLVKIEPDGLKCVQQSCRLCLSAESVEDVFGEKELHQLISDFLSIQISNDDRLGHAVCAICQLRIIEFHQFWTRCHEVQEVLQSMVRNLNVDAGEELSTKYVEKQSTFFEPPEVKTEPSEESDFAIATEQESVGLKPRTETQSTVEVFSHDQLELQPVSGCTGLSHDMVDGQVENDLQSCIKDDIDIEEAEIEYLINDDEESHERISVDKEVLIAETITAGTTQIVENDEETGIGETGQCSKCNKIFPTKLKLSLHMRTVHGPKNHSCNACGISFPYRKELKRHEHTKYHLLQLSLNQTDHAHVEEDSDRDQNWQCSKCSKSFPDKQEPQALNRCHKCKTFECHICGKPCAFKFTLIRHILTHDASCIRQQPGEDANAGPSNCNICQKEFVRRSTLRWHKIQVHGPKRHECHICGAKFSTRTCLCRHVKIHYRDKKKLKFNYSDDKMSLEASSASVKR